jgi:hypothetical protein
MCGASGPALEASAGVRKHVDQPAGAAGDVVAAEKGIDLVVAVRTDVNEVVSQVSSGSGNRSSPGVVDCILSLPITELRVASVTRSTLA